MVKTLFYQCEDCTICRVLPIAPSTYYRTKKLEFSPEKRSQRSQHDDFYLGEIQRIWSDSKCRYGTRKVWKQLKSEGVHPARCTVERLMRQHGIRVFGEVKVR